MFELRACHFPLPSGRSECRRKHVAVDRRRSIRKRGSEGVPFASHGGGGSDSGRAWISDPAGKEELVVQAPVGLRFVRGAAVVWIGYSVVALPARARMEDGHWWVDADTVLSVFSRFLKRNGRNVALQWSGAGKRQTPPAERESVERKKTPVNDASQRESLRQEQQKRRIFPG